jgi:hypothetical protein
MHLETWAKRAQDKDEWELLVVQGEWWQNTNKLEAAGDRHTQTRASHFCNVVQWVILSLVLPYQNVCVGSRCPLYIQ